MLAGQIADLCRGALWKHCNNPQKVVVVFEKMLKSFEDHVQTIAMESRTLTALCDMLMPKLISGDIWVKDAYWLLKERGL
jgi:hypothetical protein